MAKKRTQIPRLGRPVRTACRRDRGPEVRSRLPAHGRGGLLHRRAGRTARHDRPRRGVAGLQPDHRLWPRHRRRTGGEPLPADAHDGTVPGGDRQGGATVAGHRETLVLHAEALAHDHSRRLPQGRRTPTSVRPSTKDAPRTARCSNRCGRATTRSPRGCSSSSRGGG